MTKSYDREYFDRWYRDGRHRIIEPEEVRRKASVAVAVAEYFLRRRVESVLDVGCGEGAWRAHIRAIRPSASYLGIDSSEYAVRRFGSRRNIRHGSVGTLHELRPRQPFDLVVCADVLHYLTDSEVRSGAGEMARLAAGAAFIEVLTSEDHIIGDLEGMYRRDAQWYDRTFARAGMRRVAPYCWLAKELAEDASALELSSRA
jgi:SAM-dependent methyltransferase